MSSREVIKSLPASLKDNLGSSRYSSNFYQIEKIGQGKFGNVYKVGYKNESKFYEAIKKIPLKSLSEKDMHLKEVRIMAKLDQINIVSYETCWIENSKQISESSECKTSECDIKIPKLALYVRMELCNRSLQAYLDNRNNKNTFFSFHMVHHISSQIVKGLTFIHASNIIHHNIRPKSIAIFKEEKRIRVKIGNFENSCCLTIDPNYCKNLGSVIYRAPEQQVPYQPCNFKSDIFSFGIVLLEVLHPMKTKQNLYTLKKEIMETKFPPQLYQELYNKYHEWAEILVKCLQVDVTRRPTTRELNRIVSRMLYQYVRF